MQQGSLTTKITNDQTIPILDFGSQYAQLIARRVREKGVYSELVRPDISIESLKAMNPMGLILSGGPSSVYEKDAPRCDPRIFELGVPVLGICYGMQLGRRSWVDRSSRPKRANMAGPSACDQPGPAGAWAP